MTAPSLRRRLLIGLLPSLAALWLLGTGYILARSWDELEEAYVDQLDQLAYSLAQMLDETVGDAAQAVDSVAERRDRNYFVLVTSDSRVVMRSARAPADLTAMPDSGDHPLYYLASATTPEGRLTVIAGLEKAEVRQLTTDIVTGVALSMALGLVAMLAVLLLTIRRALAPLDALRGELEARQPDALDPMPVARLPAELAPVAAALNRLLDRLRHALAAERRFVADASHELRTPLTAIRAQLDTIDRDGLPPDTRRALDQIRRAVDRSSRLAQQLLRLARADAAPAAPAPPLHLDQQLAAILSDLFPLALRHDNALELDCTPVLLAIAAEDLEMLVANLVENAIHHGGPGGSVRVGCGEDSAGLWLRVEDAGPGIDPADLPRLFDRFHRGSSAGAGGAGLGLAIVAAIAQRTGARLVLDRAPDLGGLRVELRFPRQL
ncbi:sensor histidine kinase [Salipiger marinus]|uniref:sensor histidine kinase n=1 Tax=Salipiger marinus TaxID=555512 RepID=UPI002BEA7577|nr:ATP-binding protein [Salipiger manganoxidans]MEB3420634.1 ATP-binding protein [Salipiger manganoxidans]